jgi:hypothetical protein
LFKHNISINQIDEPGYTLCWAAKWLGKPRLLWESITHHDDFIKGIWDLLDEADIVIHYNGSKFDIPVLNKEFILASLPPPSPFHEIDLYKTCRGRFRFASNKLDYVSQVLGVGKKLSHKGMELWEGCMNDNQPSWNVMRRYNKQDVVLLEPLYEKLKPWIQPHPNVNLWAKPSSTRKCPSCGSGHLNSRGTVKTLTQAYLRFQCQDCGKWSRAKTTVLSVAERAATLVGVS